MLSPMLLPMSLCARVCGLSRREGGDLYQVVGQDAVSAPGSGTGQAVQAGAVPAVSVLEVADASFAAGAPLDQFAK